MTTRRTRSYQAYDQNGKEISEDRFNTQYGRTSSSAPRDGINGRTLKQLSSLDGLSSWVMEVSS